MFIFAVAPYVGAWIEISHFSVPSAYSLVAPYVGAWIKISSTYKPKCRKIIALYVGAELKYACLPNHKKQTAFVPYA